MFVNRSDQNDHCLYKTFHICFLPNFGSFGQAVSEETIFRNQPIRNKNCLCRPCLWTDQDEISNLHGGPSIHASYQFSMHWAKQFHMKRCFRNRPIWKKNWLWQPYLLWDRDEINNIYRESYIDASVNLATLFQRRTLKYEKLTDAKRCQ
jgi:hypothetical protein